MIVILALAVPALAATATKTTKAKARVATDATRLAALLNDVQHSARFETAVWKTTVNEANTLANRVYANTGGRKEAKELRMHVREMRQAALKDDADGAREHAREALPFAYQIIDWASE
jgi:siroheme synthase (precorrin-2 oxidase/ferrochelatase)